MIQAVVGREDELCSVDQVKDLVKQIPSSPYNSILEVEKGDRATFLSSNTPKFMEGLINQIEYWPCAPPKEVTEP